MTEATEPEQPEQAVPAEDPTPAEPPVAVKYTDIFAGMFNEILTAISGVGNTRVNKQSQYRLKAADVALQLTGLAITRSAA